MNYQVWIWKSQSTSSTGTYPIGFCDYLIGLIPPTDWRAESRDGPAPNIWASLRVLGSRQITGSLRDSDNRRLSFRKKKHTKLTSIDQKKKQQ